MKPLLPSLKERKRYIVFEVYSEMKFNEQEVSKVIKDNLQKYTGEKGLALAGMQLTNWNDKLQRGIVRVNHDQADNTKASFIFIESINNAVCSVHSIGMSGILNKAKQQYLR